MRQIKPIGISGVAGSGKDTFYLFLKERGDEIGINFQRFAFADKLKEKTRDFILENFNIDIVKATRKEKEVVRQFLVEFGKIKRKQTNGRYFIDLIKNDLLDAVAAGITPVITDIRYDEYASDEAFFIKEEMKGLLVHVARLDYKDYGFEIAPANEEEAKNDPRLKSKADYAIIWPTFKDLKFGTINKKDEESCRASIFYFIENFIDYVEQKS